MLRITCITQNSQEGEIQLPTMKKQNEWSTFDEDVDQILERVIIGCVERKLETLTAIILSDGQR